MNNTGIATFANDCVFTTPNPAQAKNPQVRNSINGFPCLLYINDELEGVYTFNLDRYSTNSLGYDTTQFPKCLSYEISANSDTTAGAFVPWSTSTGKTEREYLAADFKCRFPDNRVNGDDDFAELKRLVDWVGNATDDMFREQIEQYFNLEYLIRYYLTVQLFGLIDNLGKNTMLTTFDGNVWYMQLYDCDSCTGLDNSGAMKFDPDIEVQVGVFNTSNSRLWDKLRRNFPNQILAQWEVLRLNEFTEENIMKYLVDNISDKIPEINYNLDAWKKYIVLGKDMLFACHGNRRQQIQRWIKERIIYVDTLLNYNVSTNDYITVRVNKLGEVHFDIQTFQPMYFSIKFRNEVDGTGTITKRIGRGETVRFSYNIPVATDQEILVYGGRFIKDLGDLSEMNPTNLILSNATRLTKVKCTNADMLINASISGCTMLQEVDLHGCNNLGAGSDASLQTLDLSACRNLRKVDISGTQLTALYTSQQGGIIQEILYPYSIQIVQVQNQARLTSLGIPCYYTGNYNDERNIFAERLSLMQVSNCPNVRTFVKNYYVNEDGSEVPVPTFIGVSKGRTFNLSNVMGHLTQIDLSYCSNIESLTLDNFYNLTEINFDDIAPYNATTSNLYNLTLTNCPNVETLTFNQNTVDGENSLGVAFKTGTALDLSGLYNLKHIRSNVGVKGLKKLILPLTISSLVFDYPTDTTYAYGDSDIEDIFSKNASHIEDDFKGIDLLDIETITDFSMGSLTKISNAINLDVKITNTFPYFNYFKTDNYFKPEGIVDISEYRGSLEYLFKGVDLDKLTVVCTEPLPHTSGKYMFAFASGEDVETLNTLFSYMPNVTDFSYMFYCGYLKHAPLIPIRAENVSYMFYNNSTMETTPSNWSQAYPSTITPSYCYTGCSGIISIDGEPGSIDDIPVAWGGFDRENLTFSGETIVVDNTLEREIINFTASGQTLQNIVPEVGQTSTIIANKSEQPVGEGLSELILIADGETPQAELEGLTLVNLASEKRSGFMGQVSHSQNIKTGLNSNFVIEDEQEVFSTVVEGNSLVNIIPEIGETTLLTNSDRSYSVEKGLDSTIIVKDGEMKQAIVYGETMTNLTDKTVPTDETTVEYKQSYLTGETIKAPIEPEDGDYNTMLIEGNTLVNIVPRDGSTPMLTNNGMSHINTDNGLDESILVKEGEMPSATLKGLTLHSLEHNGETPTLTTGGLTMTSTERGLDSDIITKDGEMTSAIMKGQSFVNLSKMSDFTKSSSQDTITYTDNGVNIVFGNHATHYGRFKNKYTSLKENTWYTTYIIVTKNTLPSDCYAQFNIRHGASGGDYRDVDEILYSANGVHFNELHIYGGMVGTFRVATYTQDYDYTLRERFFGTLWNVIMPDGKASDYYAGSELEYGVIVIEGDTLDLGNPKYFSGIGSVKAPTLTTYGKNLFNHKKDSYKVNGIIVNPTVDGFELDGTCSGYQSWDLLTGEFIGNSIPDLTYYSDKILANCSGEYIFSFNVGRENATELGNGILISLTLVYDDTKSEQLSWDVRAGDSIELKRNITVKSHINGVFAKRWYGGRCDGFKFANVQIEQGTQKTTYEPYKTSVNITTPSDVVLRGGKDVSGNVFQDTLDLTTGKLTRVYDWWDLKTLLQATAPHSGFSYNSSTNKVYVQWNLINTHNGIANGVGSGGYNALIVSPMFRFTKNFGANSNLDYNAIGFFNKYLYLNLPYEPFSNVTLENETTLNGDEAKEALYQYLTDNPCEIGIALKNPREEQIDLSDQPKPYAYKDGSIYLSSSELTPTLDYKAQSPNNLVFPTLKTNTEYTLFGKGANGQTFSLCGTNLTISELPMVVTSGSTDDTNVLPIGDEIKDFMIVEGSYPTQDVAYFEGYRSVEINAGDNLIHTTTKNLMITPPNGASNTPGVSGKDVTVTYNNGEWHFEGSLTNSYAQFNLINLDYAGGTNASSYISSFISTNPKALTNPNIGNAVLTWKTRNNGTTGIISLHALYEDGTAINFSNGILGTTVPINLASKPIIGLLIKFWQTFDTIDFTLYDLQLEYSTDGTKLGYTDYVPAKSTAITSPSNLVLHSVYDKKDYLDIKTGILTHKTRKCIFNDEVSYGATALLYNRVDGYIDFRFDCNNFENNYQGDSGWCIAIGGIDWTPHTDYNWWWGREPMEVDCIIIHRQYIDGRIRKDRLSEETADAIKAFLASCNLTILYALTNPYTEQIDLSSKPKPYAYKDGAINLATTTITPTLEYQSLSSNNFTATATVKPATTYTMYGNNANNQTIKLCGNNTTITSLPMLVTSGGASSDNIFISGDVITDVMLIEGDVRDQDINYFTGVNSVIEPTINTYTYNLLHQTSREFDFTASNPWATFNSSMHNNVYTLECTKVGSNLQPRFGFFKGFYIRNSSQMSSNYLEDNPIFETGKTYTLSFDMHYTIENKLTQDERTVLRLHFINKDGAETADFTPIGDFGSNHLIPYLNTKSTIIMDNLSDDGWYEVKLHYYFTFTPNVDVYSIVWFAQYGGSYLFNMEVSNIQVTESTEELPYIIPVYKGVNDTQGIELRKLPNGVCDSYNPITGEYVQRVTYTDVNDYSTYSELETPIITYKEKQQPYAVNNSLAKIETSTNTVFPKLTYSMQSKNVFDTTRWGIGRKLTQRNIAQMYINGSTTPLIPTETLTFTEQQLSSGTIVLNSNGNDIVVVNEDYSGRDIPYFEGMRSVESLEISSKKDNEIKSSVQIPKHVKLNGLPNGVRDSLDLRTGLLTRNVYELTLDGTESWEKQSDSYWFTDTHTSYRLIGDGRLSNFIANPWDGGTSRAYISDEFKSLAPSTANMNLSVECIMLEKYEDSTSTVINIKIAKDKLANDTVESFKSYLQENPVTLLYQMKTPTEEKLILNTNNSCDYGLELPTGATDKYNVLTKAYTQNIKSILLDGTHAWDSMEELSTTIKFCATSTSVGVSDLNMKGSGGLYCDNDMFPNINNDLDIEHCRVDVEGNKFYIFINKERLLSPDLVGFQIWLQENPFTMWYELNSPIMLTKEYNELDPSQARWSMVEAYRNGTLEYKSNSDDGLTLYPIMDYIAKSSNSFVASMLKPDTSYTVYATDTLDGNKINLGGREQAFSTGNVYTSGNTKRITFNSCPSVNNIVVVEGNTTLYHVPNFTGSINVKNPRLKIIGNNEIGIFNYSVESTPNPNIVLVGNNLTMTTTNKNEALVYETWLQTGTTYTLSYNSNFLDVYAYDMYGTLLGSSTITDKSDVGATQQVKLSFVSPSTGYVKFKITNGEATGECNLNNLLLRKGTSTVYEAYKENTVHATCELRGIGSVKDKLDLSSTAYNMTKVIKEIVLDGTENWNTLSEDANGYIGFIMIPDIKMGGVALCDQYATYKSINDLVTNVNGIYVAEQQQYVYLSIAKESLGRDTITIDRFKEYISKTKPVLRYELATPVTTTQPYLVSNSNNLVTNKICAFSEGSIVINSDSKLAPKLTYSLPSANSFHLKNLKTGTRYTLKYPSASGTITIGNISYSINSNSMLFTTPLKITGDTTSIVFSDENPQDVILLEGVYNTREVPLFSGIKSVSNPIITVVNNATGETTSFASTENVELRSLPNGLADKLDIVRGKLTTVVGYREYQEGDENLTNVLTDGYNTAYPLATPVVKSVVFNIPSVTSDSKIKLSSDYLIPQLNYRAKSSNNFPLDLLEGNSTYTLYADTLVSGNYSLGGVHGGVFTGTEVIALGDITNNLLTFEGDLGLSNVMLIKGNSINMTVPYFKGIKTVKNSTFYIEGYAGESNEHIMDNTVTLRSCSCGTLKDYIDMKTGVLTKNLSEVTLNGTESWTIISSLENVDSDYVLFGLTKVGAKNSQVTAITCDRFNHSYLLGLSHAEECIYSIDNQIRLCVKQSTINGNTVNALKSWLNQNNTTVIYALATPETYTLTSTWATTPITSYDTQTTFRTEVVDSLKPILSVTVATTTLEQTVSGLEAKNAALEEENLATMLALTDLYETMVAPSVVTTSVEPEPQATTYSMRRSVRSAEPIGMSVSPMGMVYARLVSKGFKSIDEVPYNLQPEVMYALRGME